MADVITSTTPDPTIGVSRQDQIAAFSAGTPPTSTQAEVLRADAAHFVATGVLSPEAANAYLQQNGIAPVEAQQQAKSDLAALRKNPEFIKKLRAGDGDAIQKLQRLTMAEGASAEAAATDMAMPPDFTVPMLSEHGKPPSAEALAGAATMRTALAASGVDRTMGNAILAESDRVSKTYTALSEDQRVAFAGAERGKLERMWGDGAAAKLALGNRLLNELAKTHPEAVAMAHRSGLTSSAVGVSMIVAHAERLAARARRK
jgi:hypothetical protein